MKKTLVFIGLLVAFRSLAAAQSVVDPSLTVQQVVSGLSFPTTMAFISANDILVLQKNDGRVRRVVGGVLQPGEVLDVAVDRESERGLLGIAVHPQFPAVPSIYLYFTESSTGADTAGSPAPLGNRVYRYTWDGSILTEPNLILDLPVIPGPNHDGGIIAFGPDGKLYVVIGDLNRNGQLQNFPSGPPPDDTGVILRLNDDGTIPDDNPFFAEGGNVAKYYAYGVRNSFGLAFDPVTEKLWMTENGPNLYDEINLVEPGFNSGWEQILGPDERDPQGIDDLFAIPGAHYRDPSFSWLDTVAPTGLVFLNSTALGAQYQNNLFVGDINNGTLYRFRPNAARDGFDFQGAGLFDLVADDPTELSEVVFGTGFGGITDLKVGPDGLLYIVSFSGQIFVVSGGAAALSVSPATVEAGGTVTAGWSGIATPTPTDWIGLYAPGAANTAFIDWIYVSCSKVPGDAQAAGACLFSVPPALAPGTYELRVLANNEYTTLATSETFSVTGGGGGPTLAASPESISPGDTLTATWDGIASPTSTDWIGLYQPGAASTSFIDWIYVSCSQTPGSAQPAGSCSFIVPASLAPDTYQLRLLAADGFTDLATSNNFSVS